MAFCRPPAVPLSYTLGGALRFPRTWQVWQPFQGGPSFVLLQAAAWFFWAWALAPFVMPLGTERPSKTCGSQGHSQLVPDLPSVHLAFSALACALAQLAVSGRFTTCTISASFLLHRQFMVQNIYLKAVCNVT